MIFLLFLIPSSSLNSSSQIPSESFPVKELFHGSKQSSIGDQTSLHPSTERARERGGERAEAEDTSLIIFWQVSTLYASALCTTLSHDT